MALPFSVSWPVSSDVLTPASMRGLVTYAALSAACSVPLQSAAGENLPAPIAVAVNIMNWAKPIRRLTARLPCHHYVEVCSARGPYRAAHRRSETETPPGACRHGAGP